MTEQGIQTVNSAKARQLKATSVIAADGTLTTQAPSVFANVPAPNAEETTLVNQYGNQYIIPLDFEFLTENGNFIITNKYAYQFLINFTLAPPEKVVMCDEAAVPATLSYQLTNPQLEYYTQESWYPSNSGKIGLYNILDGVSKRCFYYTMYEPVINGEVVEPNILNYPFNMRNDCNWLIGFWFFFEPLYPSMLTYNKGVTDSESFQVNFVSSITDIKMNGEVSKLYPAVGGLLPRHVY